MTPNQLPPLPEPFALSVSVHDGDTPAKTYVECLLYQKHPNEKQRLYTADQMHAYALAALAQQAQPVHQFRRRLCADWYDGHPDHEDGGGPYETRILYTTPPAPQVPAPVDELPGLNPEDIVVAVVFKQLGGFAPVTAHGVRVTHKPSRVSVVVDSERSQHKNRQLALQALRSIISEEFKS